MFEFPLLQAQPSGRLDSSYSSLDTRTAPIDSGTRSDHRGDLPVPLSLRQKCFRFRPYNYCQFCQLSLPSPWKYCEPTFEFPIHELGLSVFVSLNFLFLTRFITVFYGVIGHAPREDWHSSKDPPFKPYLLALSQTSPAPKCEKPSRLASANSDYDFCSLHSGAGRSGIVCQNSENAIRSFNSKDRSRFDSTGGDKLRHFRVPPETVHAASG